MKVCIQNSKNEDFVAFDEFGFVRDLSVQTVRIFSGSIHAGF